MSTLASPAAGDEVMVVFEENGARAMTPGDVVRCGPGVLDVVLRTEVLFPGGRPVTLLTGEGDESRYARIVASERSRERITLRTGAWRPVLNRRGQPRYPMFLSCRLEGPGASVDGRCVDLSIGGAAIEVVEWNQHSFNLVLSAAPPLSIACRTVALEPTFFAVVVHAAFEQCTPEVAAAIHALVEHGRYEFEDAQRQLAHRIDDPSPGVTARGGEARPAGLPR